MASKTHKKVKEDTSRLNKRAIGKTCDICRLFITESEADDQNIIHISTKRGTEVFMHIDCWRKSYGKSK